MIFPDERRVKYPLRTVLRKIISDSRYRHCVNTAEYAERIAANRLKKKAYVAGLLHDCGKRIDLKKAGKITGLTLRKYSGLKEPLLHCRLGAEIARKVFGVKDKDILYSIKWHATGSDKMPETGRLLVIADLCSRGRRFPGLSALRRLSGWNSGKPLKGRKLDAAYRECLKRKILFVLEENRELLNHTVKAYNSVDI